MFKAFKVGDIVIRKKDYRDCGNWEHDSRPMAVTSVAKGGHGIGFEGGKSGWEVDYFELYLPEKKVKLGELV